MIRRLFGKRTPAPPRGILLRQALAAGCNTSHGSRLLRHRILMNQSRRAAA